MIKIKAVLYSSDILLLLSACSNIDSTSSIKKQLIGRWVLDSASNPNGSYYKSEECNFITFENDTNFIYEWVCGCIHQKFQGKYFILHNPKRELQTVFLIPDIYIDEKDTVRTEYIHFDIVSINSDRLQVIDETKFIKQDSSRSIRFNKNYIYKQTK